MLPGGKVAFFGAENFKHFKNVTCGIRSHFWCGEFDKMLPVESPKMLPVELVKMLLVKIFQKLREV
jgi:hypothetical protein